VHLSVLVYLPEVDVGIVGTLHPVYSFNYTRVNLKRLYIWL
jgi:hypothetical protein